MAARNKKKVPIYVWIPPVNTANYKITIEDSTGTINDMTDIISFFEIEDGVTESIGKFQLNVWDPNETYKSLFTGNEIVRYYSDYAATATTLRFRGRIEKPSKRGNRLKLTGRSEGVKLIDVTVTQSYTDTETSEILKDIVNKYGPQFTVTNVTTSNTKLTVNWYQKPFWDCVQELTTAAGFDCYLSALLDFHYFETGSVVNTTEGIIHDNNMLDVGDFAPDLAEIKNRVIVYGAEQQGIKIMYTAENDDPDSKYSVDSDFGVREEPIEDTNVTSETMAQQLADATLAQRQNPPIVGDVKGTLLATIQPGQSIRISSPADDIQPGNYQCAKYKQTLDIEGGGVLATTVSILKEPRKIYHVIKTIIENQNKGKDTSINPEEMRYSYNFLFNTDEGSHDKTEITDGILKLQTGQSSGKWVSPTRTTPSNVSAIYLVVNGETLTGATYRVTGNGGQNYQTATNRGRTDLTTATGSQLSIEVSLTDTKTQITSLSVQYKY